MNVKRGGGWVSETSGNEKSSQKEGLKAWLVFLSMDQTGQTLQRSALTKRQDYILSLFVLPLTSLHSDTLMRPDTRLLSKFSC